MKGAKLRLGSVLGGIIAFLCLYYLIKVMCNALDYKYFHISDRGKFAMLILFWIIVTAMFIWLAVMAVKNYPGGSLFLVGCVAMLLFLIFIMCSFSLNTATNSFTGNSKHLGSYDYAVEELLNSEPCGGFLPKQLPKGSTCVSYSYLYDSYLSDHFEIQLVCEFLEDDTFSLEVQRLKTYFEGSSSCDRMEVNWIADADKRIITYWVST